MILYACAHIDIDSLLLLLPISLSQTVMINVCLSNSFGRVSKKNSSLKTGFRLRHFILVLYFLRLESGRSCLQRIHRENNHITHDDMDKEKKERERRKTYSLTNASEKPFLSIAIKLIHRLITTERALFCVLQHNAIKICPFDDCVDMDSMLNLSSGPNGIVILHGPQLTIYLCLQHLQKKKEKIREGY